jgi:hypothetical protein
VITTSTAVAPSTSETLVYVKAPPPLQLTRRIGKLKRSNDLRRRNHFAYQISLSGVVMSKMICGTKIYCSASSEFQFVDYKSAIDIILTYDKVCFLCAAKLMNLLPKHWRRLVEIEKERERLEKEAMHY